MQIITVNAPLWQCDHFYTTLYVCTCSGPINIVHGNNKTVTTEININRSEAINEKIEAKQAFANSLRERQASRKDCHGFCSVKTEQSLLYPVPLGLVKVQTHS